MVIWGGWGFLFVMGLGLFRNRVGRFFIWRLSGNIWFFWVVCSCKRTGKSIRGVGGVWVFFGGGVNVMERNEGKVVEDGGLKGGGG